MAGAPVLITELEIDRDYRGPVHSIAFDAKGVAWIATPEVVYKVAQGGKPEPVESTPRKYFQRALAPRGGLYAGLVTENVPGGLFTIELVPLSGGPEVRLRHKDFPFGFGELYLGGAGELIVTATPLDSVERLGGRFLYIFWSRSGQPLSQVTLMGRRTGVVDVAGNALLLLGETEAIAFSKEGQELWRLDESFRMGALAADGRLALLNPAEKSRISEVHVVESGKVTRIDMRSTVYELALTADGSVGAVAVNEGGLSFISPETCIRSLCEPRAVESLPVAPVGGTFLISSMRFVNSTTLVVGVIRRVGDPSDYIYPSGAVLVVPTSGQPVFVKDVALKQRATWAPLIDVTYGLQYFAARTPHKALLWSLGPMGATP